jgi:hypothetical protein
MTLAEGWRAFNDLKGSRMGLWGVRARHRLLDDGPFARASRVGRADGRSTASTRRLETHALLNGVEEAAGCT